MWEMLYPKENQPALEDILAFAGEGSALWQALLAHMDTRHRAKPAYAYSGCSGKPGWNVKFKKGSVGFGTFYPEENGFTVLIVLPYRLDAAIQAILPELSEACAQMYQTAGDYMKIGKWLMFAVTDTRSLKDCLLLIDQKRAVPAR